MWRRIEFAVRCSCLFQLCNPLHSLYLYISATHKSPWPSLRTTQVGDRPENSVVVEAGLYTLYSHLHLLLRQNMLYVQCLRQQQARSSHHSEGLSIMHHALAAALAVAVLSNLMMITCLYIYPIFTTHSTQPELQGTPKRHQEAKEEPLHLHTWHGACAYCCCVLLLCCKQGAY